MSLATNYKVSQQITNDLLACGINQQTIDGEHTFKSFQCNIELKKDIFYFELLLGTPFNTLDAAIQQARTQIELIGLSSHAKLILMKPTPSELKNLSRLFSVSFEHTLKKAKDQPQALAPENWEQFSTIEKYFQMIEYGLEQIAFDKSEELQISNVIFKRLYKYFLRN